MGGDTLTRITTFFAVNSNAFAWGYASDSYGASAGASGHVSQTATSSGDNHHPTPAQIERVLSDITPEISQLFSNPAEFFRRLVRESVLDNIPVLSNTFKSEVAR